MTQPHTTPNVKGIPLALGGKTYTLPPSSLATLEAFAKPLDEMNAVFAGTRDMSVRDMLFVADFAHACLLRNYPDMTRAEVAQNIGLENVVDVMQMCLDTSGLMRKAIEDKNGAQPATTTAQEGGTLGESTGTASSPTS
jgi:hypothetical protein